MALFMFALKVCPLSIANAIDVFALQLFYMMVYIFESLKHGCMVMFFLCTRTRRGNKQQMLPASSARVGEDRLPYSIAHGRPKEKYQQKLTNA